MLTEQQRQTVVNYINSDPLFQNVPRTADGSYEVAAILEQDHSPDFFVWRSSITQDEIFQGNFDWVQVDNLTAGQARIWEWLFDNQEAKIDPSKANVRAAINECWKGTAGKLAVGTAILNASKRKANRIEKLLASGTGTSQDPATMEFEGSLSPQYLREILGW